MIKQSGDKGRAGGWQKEGGKGASGSQSISQASNGRDRYLCPVLSCLKRFKWLEQVNYLTQAPEACTVDTSLPCLGSNFFFGVSHLLCYEYIGFYFHVKCCVTGSLVNSNTFKGNSDQLSYHVCLIWQLLIVLPVQFGKQS